MYEWGGINDSIYNCEAKLLSQSFPQKAVRIFFFRGGEGETDTFPQPEPEVINWDSDPRQQSLLLVL